MAKDKEALRILCPDLTQVEKAHLMQLINMPGWKVVTKIANAACLRASQDTIRLDPESEDYERVCVERQRRARNITEFSDLLMRSVHEHAEALRKVHQQEDADAVASVGEMFGIHPAASPAKKGDAKDAIKNIYGIHPAKPKNLPNGKKQ